MSPHPTSSLLLRTPFALLAVALVAAASASACSHSAPPPESAEPACGEAQPQPAEPEPAPPSPQPSSFTPSGLICRFVSIEGELLSCESVSAEGASNPAAEENCQMLGARLERAECPTANVLGVCDTTDGAQLRGEYPLRITYYRTQHMPDTTIPRRSCDTLDGQFTEAP